MKLKSLDDQSLDILFRAARTYYAWQDRPVEDDLLKRVYDIAKMGPTSANCCPMRVVFVKTAQAKERLKPALSPGNVEKTMTAPVTAIFGIDYDFYEHMPFLFPHADGKAMFEGNQDLINSTAQRNATLQAAYFMLAARSLGLDCGPMQGYDSDQVAKEFFPNTNIKPNFLCNLGYGDGAKLYPRSPRFDFDTVCKVI